MIVELALNAPVLPVYRWAPHPCGGYYIEDAKVYGLNWPARPAPGHLHRPTEEA